jgi:hypothetical protein
VVDPRRYTVPDSDAIPTSPSPDGQSATADLCGLSWDGLGAVVHGTTAAGLPAGPQLGRLDLTRVLGQGYRITHLTRC